MSRAVINTMRGSDKIWKPQGGGIFNSRRLADNLVECLKAAGETWEFAIVEGLIVSPESMAEAEARLGPF